MWAFVLFCLSLVVTIYLYVKRNKIFDSIIQNNIIEKYKDYKLYKKEKKYKDSRFDFYVEKADGNKEYIEINADYRS